MSTIGELEHALAVAWSDDTLAVYGDQLQAIGDPRGDLVAIDRHLAAAPATPELLAHRRERLEAWLGFDPRGWPSTRFDRGFIDARGDEVPRVLLYDLARYLRGVTIDDDYHVSRLVERLASRPRPFLARLGIASHNRDHERLVDPSLVEQLIAAAPNLVRLELHGDRILPAFPHPRLRELAITGLFATASLHEPGPPLAAVEEVSLAQYISSTEVPGAILPAANFPALRRLDLTRYEPDALRYHIHAIDVLPQLEHLALPTVPDDATVEVMQVALARAHALRELHVFGPRHPRLARLHRTARLAVRPWPSPSSLAWHERLVVLIVKGYPVAYGAPLDSAIAYLEGAFDRLPAPVQAAWIEIWDAIGALPPPPPRLGDDDTEPGEIASREVPVAVLVRALAETADRIDQAWVAVARAVADAPGPSVAIRRSA